MSSVNIKTSKPERVAEKIFNYVCCDGARICPDWCYCWSEEEPPQAKKINKADIQPVVLNHQPAARLDSINSTTSCGSALSGSQFSFSAQNSPSFRERVDSDQSSSRKGSTSSGSEYCSSLKRSSATPVIDMKPIEFWAATNREAVQPRTPKRRLPSESEISIDDFKPDLYEIVDQSGDESLTDEEKLERFQLGQMHFSLQYEIPTKSLVVRLIEARDLPYPSAQQGSDNTSTSSRQMDQAHSNPYAKVCLLPDHKNSQQTCVQRKTQSPSWGQMFRFELAFKDAQRRTLEITVKDFDKFSRHCVIGQVHLPLENVNMIKGGHMWKPLLPCTLDKPDLGEVLLSLNYLPTAGRLNVDIIKAKQLLQTDFVGGSDPFVKVTLCLADKHIKTKKTSIKKNTIDPVFNESVSFNVSVEHLSNCSLIITVWDYNSKSRDDLVGRFVLGRQSSGPYQVSHWNKMMQCQRSPVAQWHTLLPREECDKKCPASAAIS